LTKAILPNAATEIATKVLEIAYSNGEYVLTLDAVIQTGKIFLILLH
jgi:hypothetical protein